MRTNWWDTMDLGLWCPGERVLAGVTTDLPFAQAVARHRAAVRGKRQRLAVEQPPHQSRPVFYAEDAPEVAEPCS